MFLPVEQKPDIVLDWKQSILEVPNAIPKELADKIRTYAEGPDSGLHRRGSKNPDCFASFYTCLIYRIDDPIYELLDPIWQKYFEIENPGITSIEPYEIKSYVEGDVFEPHTDENIRGNKIRKLNMIIQLSDPSEYDGGLLYVGRQVCSREFGTAIFFPAGAMHGVTQITRGKRYSLIGHAWGPL